ncbi:hypothetical protein M885DRAFT_519009, partial [Pelagophyceae sp. CCMP2097]
MSHASQPPFVIAGGAAVACGAAALWLRRRRRSRLTHPPFSVSIGFKTATLLRARAVGQKRVIYPFVFLVFYCTAMRRKLIVFG